MKNKLNSNNITVKPLTEIIGPVLAIDVAVFTLKEGRLNVLLLKTRDQFAGGDYVLPGGFVALEETLDESAKRNLLRKANININYLEQLYTFGTVNRDTRGRVVSVAYFALVDYKHFNLKTTDRYSSVGWSNVDELPSLGYDHQAILTKAVERIRTKLQYSNLAAHLLPKSFSLTQLQKTYEDVIGEPLDKRNFRRKVLSIKIIEPVSTVASPSAHRPAQLYRFVSKKYQEVSLI